ncbi:MAG: hypothetical protein GY834_03180, partial [Bacteroidetes bacterium]|nr:hypothetical protein [Bacteroidota bacterium]
NDAGWIADNTENVSWVSEEDYDEKDECYEYFVEAKEHGSCLVFHTWPADAEDAADSEVKH